MKWGLAVSLALHIGILGAALVTWAAPDPLDAPMLENVSVEIIDAAEITGETQLTEGDETGDAAAEEIAQREVEAVREAIEPREGEVRDAPPVEVAREVTPPPAPEPVLETPTVREIPIVREIPTVREIEPARPAPVAEAPAPTPIPEPQPEPQPEPEVASAPPPLPLARPSGLRAPPPEPVQVAETEIEAEPEPAPTPEPETVVQEVPIEPIAPPPPPPAEPDPLDITNPDTIAALLNKQDPVAAATPTDANVSETPSLGEASGTAQTLTVSEIDALRRQLARCWSPPIGSRGADALSVRVRMELNLDGTVQGIPNVVDPPFGPGAGAAMQAATSAVLRCQPYLLPPEKFPVWQTITFNFDPRQMLGL